jgi:hypothetical protein
MKFIDILQEYHIPHKKEGHHHCRPGWVQLDCPFCGKGTGKFHLGYSLSDNYCACWRCGGHHLIKVVAELTGLPYNQTAKLIGTLSTEKDKTTKKTGRLVIPPGVIPLMDVHRRYLMKRGFDWTQLVETWDVQGVGVGAKVSWSIFIPIHYRGEVVSWTTRAIGKRNARYCSAAQEEESIPHKDLLFGEDYCTHTIIITEGPFDVFMIGPGAVATFGTAYSSSQVSKMTRYPRRYVCFDNDRESQRRANFLCDQLSVFAGDTYNIHLTSKDAGEACPKELAALRRLVK